MTLVAGARLNNRYRILTVLGLGGMGAVYQALDENLGIFVAVKENLYLSEEFSRQFEREASVLAGLRHSNLPRVSDYFTIPNQGQYIIMDFIGGEDLRQRIEREGALPERDVVLIGADICDALSYLHSRTPPIIHRDIKPGNIKITAERDVILVDFGLVKVVQGKQPTITGARAMTPGYSPPEQYGAARTDARTDVYSLGATLYASLSGMIPEDSFERVTGKASLTPLVKIKPRVNKKLAAVIEKSLETDAEKRYQTASEFKDALLASCELTAHFQEKMRVSFPPPSDAGDSGQSFNQVESPHPYPAVGSIEQPRGLAGLSFYLRKAAPLGILALLASALLFVAFSKNIIPSGSESQMPAPSETHPPADASTPPPATLVTPAESSPTDGSEPPAAPEAAVRLPEPTSTPFGGYDSKIVFSSNRTGTYQLWLMKPDGSEQRQLTSLPEGACQPDWSPDGSQLLFISPCPGKQDSYPGASIYMINSDGTDIRPFPLKRSPQGDYDPAWSPDGRYVAFTSLRTSLKPHVFIYDMQDGNMLDISNSPYGDKQPAWAPGGLQLAYVRMFPNSQIWIASNNGASQFRFSLTGAVVNQMPVWSPRGQEIFYSQTSLDNSIPYLVGMDYENRSKGPDYRIPAKGLSDSAPVFHVSISPDGYWMVFESWPDGTNHDIYLTTITGAGRKRLTTDRGMDFDPTWQPAAK